MDEAARAQMSRARDSTARDLTLPAAARDFVAALYRAARQLHLIQHSIALCARVWWKCVKIFAIPLARTHRQLYSPLKRQRRRQRSASS